MNCPRCRGSSVAKILWGYASDLRSISGQLERKEIVLGGCFVTDHDPKWACNSCDHRWGERDD